MKTAFYLIFSVALACMLYTGAVAGEKRQIVLEDGSIIHAEVLGFEDGVYRLRSKSMGEFELADEAIRTIGSAQSQAQTAPQEKKGEDVEDLQSSMISSPALLSMIFALQNEPEIQDILQDEEVMRLIAARDFDSLEDNPKFIRLMENPKMRAIIERMTN